MDGWAYRTNGSTANGGVWDISQWTFSSPNALDGESSNGTATDPFPINSFAAPGGSGGTQSSPIFNGITAGSYNVSVRDDNGCIYSEIVNITEPPLLVPSSSSGEILCFGGTTTVSVTATGGTPPYIGTGDFEVTAGTYTYDVTDANGCTFATTITVDEPPLLVPSSSSGEILCFGGTTIVSVSATGGTPPYIGTGDFEVTAGTYTYDVTDANGCTYSTTITVDEPPLLVPSSSSEKYSALEERQQYLLRLLVVLLLMLEQVTLKYLQEHILTMLLIRMVVLSQQRLQ